MSEPTHCHDDRHSEPCPLPCVACAEECETESGSRVLPECDGGCGELSIECRCAEREAIAEREAQEHSARIWAIAAGTALPSDARSKT